MRPELPRTLPWLAALCAGNPNGPLGIVVTPNTLTPVPTPQTDSYGPHASGRKVIAGVPTEARTVLATIGPWHWSRPRILSRFRASGGNLDRWARSDREAMVDAITVAEDALEVHTKGRDTEERRALRDIRRRLELELWP